MLLSLIACQEYQLIGPQLGEGFWPEGAVSAPESSLYDMADTPDEDGMVPTMVPTTVEAQASVNVRVEYGNFGDMLTQCQKQVAFYAIEEDDGYGEGNTAGEITQPEAAGTCAYTAFESTGGTGGSMTVRGTLDAGEAVTMWDAERIALARHVQADELTYQASCTAETYPFGRVLSLSGRGTSGGIGTFTLPDAVVFTPAVEQLWPTLDDADDGVFVQSVGVAFDWEWAWQSPWPEIAGEPAAMSQMFFIRNYRRSDNALIEAIACKPSEDGWVTVPAETMSLLTPDPGDDSLYASAQLDTYAYGLEGEAPWGESVRVQSRLAVSGLLRLTE